MACLALDLGWRFGWCLRRKGGRLTHGFVDLRAHHATDGLRLLAKRQWLTAKLKELTDAGETLDRTFYERITFVGRNQVKTPHAHGAQLGAVQSWAALKKVREPEGIDWDDVKLFVSGGHRTASQQMILSIIQKDHPEVVDHNEASAIAVMRTALHMFPARATA